LLLGGAFLQLTGNGIFPLFHLAVADELSSFVEAMDKDNVVAKLGKPERVRLPQRLLPVCRDCKSVEVLKQQHS
jgi:hypothetical protein